MPPDSSRPFLHRLLHIVAILGIAGGAVMLAQQGMYFVQEPWSSRVLTIGRGNWFVLYFVANAIDLGASVLLLIASIGLFQWKSWARVGLIIWAAIEMVGGVIMIAFYVMYYSKYLPNLRATSQPTVSTQQIVIGILGSLFGILYGRVFPLAVAWIMLQPEVKDLWSAPRARGFDVIPAAQAVIDDSHPPIR
jgi:hypothetical protein